MSDVAPNEQVTNTQAPVYNNSDIDIATAREEFKNAITADARKAAAAKIAAYNAAQGKDYQEKLIKWNTEKLAEAQKDLAKVRDKYSKLDKQRKIAEALASEPIGMQGGFNVSLANKLNQKFPHLKFSEADVAKVRTEMQSVDKKSYINNLKRQYNEEIKKRNKLVKDINNYKAGIKSAKATLKKLEANGSNGYSAGGGYSDGYSNGGSYSDGYTTTPYQDKDGNMVTATYDRNNQMQEVQFKDQEGKDQKLKADEIKKANVNIDDIKAALESGDLRKALELLLAALVSKQNNYQIAGTTKEYKENDLVFKVEKSGQDITSISFQADGMKEPYIAGKEQFEKAGTNPKDIEQALEKKDFKTAAKTIIGVQEANQTDTRARQEPELALKGNTIVLKDSVGQEFELNEAYLVSCGVKKSTAKGTMKKLSEALAIRPTPKGLEQAVGSYFRGEKPSPILPEIQKGQWSFSKTNKTIVNQGLAMAGVTSSDISITVTNDNGVKKKLKAEDFANYYGCDKKQGKKILKAYARAIDDGADMSGILSEIASNSKQSSKKRRGKVEEIAIQAGKGLASEAKNKVYSIEEDLLRRAKNAALGRD